jgi:hypothetical protein
MDITLGADPEVLLTELYTGSFKSVIGLVGGTKEKPIPVEGFDGFSLLEDNVALELNMPPAANEGEFELFCITGLDIVNSFAKNTNLKVSKKTSGIYSDQELSSDAARVFGCSEDWNAWTLDVNPTPKAENSNLRTAAGHIHIGWEKPNMKQAIQVVRLMELLLFKEDYLHFDPIRKQLYGKSGAFRPKPYGVECRSFGNWWFLNPKKYARYVFRLASYAVNNVVDGYKIPDDCKNSFELAINTGKIDTIFSNLLRNFENVCS